jgi:predicted O-methyltransferase YrrM
VTVELGQSRFEAAREHFREQAVEHVVTQLFGSYADVDLMPFAPYDLAFFDASRFERAQEFARAEPFLRRGAWVAFHDVGTNNPGVAAPILELEARGRVKLLEVRTPRGLLVGHVP